MSNSERSQLHGAVTSAAPFTVAGLCLLAWQLRLSARVKLIGDSILVGFKNRSGFDHRDDPTTEPFWRRGGGYNFFGQAFLMVGQLGPNPASCACRRGHRGRAVFARRAPAPRQTGDPCGCGPVNRCGDSAWTSRASAFRCHRRHRRRSRPW